MHKTYKKARGWKWMGWLFFFAFVFVAGYDGYCYFTQSGFSWTYPYPSLWLSPIPAALLLAVSLYSFCKAAYRNYKARKALKQKRPFPDSF